MADGRMMDSLSKEIIPIAWLDLGQRARMRHEAEEFVLAIGDLTGS
jgi:hypothetical protein